MVSRGTIYCVSNKVGISAKLTKADFQQPNQLPNQQPPLTLEVLVSLGQQIHLLMFVRHDVGRLGPQLLQLLIDSLWCVFWSRVSGPVIGAVTRAKERGERNAGLEESMEGRNEGLEVSVGGRRNAGLK